MAPIRYPRIPHVHAARSPMVRFAIVCVGVACGLVWHAYDTVAGRLAAIRQHWQRRH